MQSILQSLEEYNAIRYASYRTAAKLQIFYKELHMQYIHLDLIAGVFERHKLSSTENAVSLDSTEIEDVISDIYFAARKEANINIDIDLITKLGVDYILHTFEKSPRGNISVFCIKMALILLCSSKLQDKYGYLYKQLANHNACLSKAAVHTFLISICKVAEMLGETTAFGHQHIQAHIDSCFAKSQGCLGLTESEFSEWIMQEPPLLSWITTFNRMNSTKHLIHNIRCSTCKITPIQGPKYTCLKCTSYNQCQTCFMFGKISNKHKLKHPIREYCIKTTNREVTKLIIELIRNKLRLCPSRTVLTNTDVIPSSLVCAEQKPPEYTSVRSTTRRRIMNDPQNELQSIINHLEEENKQLQIELIDIKGTRAERLQQHRATIESQLQRLKMLKKYLFTNIPTVTQGMSRMQSTPMIHPVSSRIMTVPIEFELSPIVRPSANDRQIVKMENHDSVKTAPFETTMGSGQPSTEMNLGSVTCSTNRSSNPGFGSILQNSQIELSTWIGGNKTELHPTDSGFSQWLNMADYNHKNEKCLSKNSDNVLNDIISIASPSPIGINRDNTPSSLQHPDKHSQHSSLQNIQGDLNDILDRLQNMVANDCLLEESYAAGDNCKLKRATTEMEDLLTGLIEGMESRKTKLTTIV